MHILFLVLQGKVLVQGFARSKKFNRAGRSSGYGLYCPMRKNLEGWLSFSYQEACCHKGIDKRGTKKRGAK